MEAIKRNMIVLHLIKKMSLNIAERKNNIHTADPKIMG